MVTGTKQRQWEERRKKICLFASFGRGEYGTESLESGLASTARLHSLIKCVELSGNPTVVTEGTEIAIEES